jgi:hypothetical protein
MRRLLLITSFPVLLAACASEPPQHFGSQAEFGASREKQIFHALTQLKADDTQRAAVLAALDLSDPKLRALSDEAASTQKQMQALDVRKPGYLDAVAPLAHRSGEIDGEKLLIKAQFNQAVASALQPDQWQAWNEIFRTRNESSVPTNEGGFDSGGRRRGGGQRGG